MTIEEQIAADKAERVKLATATRLAFAAADALVSVAKAGLLADAPPWVKQFAEDYDKAAASVTNSKPRL